MRFDLYVDKEPRTRVSAFTREENAGVRTERGAELFLLGVWM